MTDSLGPCSSPAAPMEDDDMLTEILLRLPPLPSSLPRASRVCKRWRRLLSDPAFHRRFRRHHRRNPPLLGFFDDYFCSFQPTLEGPDRVPPETFSLQHGSTFSLLGCRHGLVLLFVEWWHQLLVWDPVTSEQHRIDLPSELDLDTTQTVINGEVLLGAGDAQCFQVVLVVARKDDKQQRRALACVYSSETGVWGDIISAPLPSRDPMGNLHIMPFTCKPAVLIGNSLYWMLAGNQNSLGILQFDLERQRLAMIEMPEDIHAKKNCEFWVMRAVGGGIGFLIVSEPDFSIELWKRKIDCDGAASWVLERTIKIDKLLRLKSEEKGNLTMQGLAENNNAVFLWTVIGIFMVQLETLQFKKILKTIISECHPFESVYTTGSEVSSRDDSRKKKRGKPHVDADEVPARRTSRRTGKASRNSRHAVEKASGSSKRVRKALGNSTDPVEKALGSSKRFRKASGNSTEAVEKAAGRTSKPKIKKTMSRKQNKTREAEEAEGDEDAEEVEESEDAEEDEEAEEAEEDEEAEEAEEAEEDEEAEDAEEAEEGVNDLCNQAITLELPNDYKDVRKMTKKEYEDLRGGKTSL